MAQKPTEFIRAGLVSCLLFAACSSGTAPSDTQLASFGVQTEGDASIAPAGLSVTGQVISIRGTLSTPCVPYGVTPLVSQRSGVVTLIVTGRQSGVGCRTSIGQYVYTAELRGVSSGRQRFVVRHEIASGAWEPTVVLDTVVALQ